MHNVPAVTTAGKNQHPGESAPHTVSLCQPCNTPGRTPCSRDILDAPGGRALQLPPTPGESAPPAHHCEERSDMAIRSSREQSRRDSLFWSSEANTTDLCPWHEHHRILSAKGDQRGCSNMERSRLFSANIEPTPCRYSCQSPNQTTPNVRISSSAAVTYTVR